jgi:Ribosome biogenesis regulatory protein (RRS1)
VYDEETGEWVPRWGYKGANKKAENEWLVELPSRPETQNGDEATENPRTALKKDRKSRTLANEARQGRNEGVDKVKKRSSSTKEVMTKKLAQRLRKSHIGKALGARTGRRR